MPKTFEDYFSEYQTDMVSICLEYVESQADMIYIYCSNEDKAIFCGFFFCIEGALVERYQLNDKINPRARSFKYKTDNERQYAVLGILNEDVERIDDVCKQFNRDVPTEMKIIYDVKHNKLTAQYRYDLVYSNISEKTADDVENEWFEEIKRENERNK